MAILSFMVLILITLAGYSSGAAMIGGKTAEMKPRMTDLLIILLIWAGAVYSRSIFTVNKWLFVAIWLGVSFILAIVVISFRKIESRIKPGNAQATCTPEKSLKELWKTWRLFSRKTGAFQSRVLLSLFYFIFLTPIGLIIKIFSDPLNINRPGRGASGSFWLSRKAIKAEIDDFRRQF